MAAEIHDRGRGPEIKGTRITVFDVMEYHCRGRDRTFISTLLRLTSEELDVAIRYIESHRDELMPVYQDMLDFAAQGNPPHVRARLERSGEKLRAFKRQLEHRASVRQVGTQPGGPDARAAG